MSKITVTVQIGNTDDKLRQVEWSKFIERVDALIQASAVPYFSGFSNPVAGWQNACWVFSILPADAQFIKDRLTDIRGSYLQDSVSWTEGDTVFI